MTEKRKKEKGRGEDSREERIRKREERLTEDKEEAEILERK